MAGTLMIATPLASGAPANESAPATANGCLPSGDSSLQARVRGAIEADINWSSAEMTCEGGMRPNNKGLRVSIAGPVVLTAGSSPAENKPVRLRFVFGITLRDTAPGVAQALPTNLTLIVEGQQKLFATLGDDKCAVEVLEVTPLLTVVADRGSSGARQRIHARGYCLVPATDLQGLERVLVSTFEFTTQVKSGDEP